MTIRPRPRRPTDSVGSPGRASVLALARCGKEREGTADGHKD